MNIARTVNGVKITGPEAKVNEIVLKFGGLDYDPTTQYKDVSGSIHSYIHMNTNFLINALIQSIVRAARESFVIGVTNEPKYDSSEDAFNALDALFDVKILGETRPEIEGLYNKIIERFKR